MLTAFCCAMLTSPRQPRESRGQAGCLVQVAEESNRKEEEDGKRAPAQYEASFPKERHGTLRDFFFFSQKVCSQGEREKKIKRRLWLSDGRITTVSPVLKAASDTSLLRKQH